MRKAKIVNLKTHGGKQVEDPHGNIHNIPENTIKLIGAPFMDKWFDEEK